ncbi:hypothetical protein C7389_107101 [Azoarcus indigens]|uniref:Uncharacterized protein n=1 Tax=Azoarcus indigens TaxID=29545 RepID=A0A4R6E0Z8_9RHOO|nr:hypothetical protein C7389_107101 [Azoarcus indigens]
MPREYMPAGGRRAVKSVRGDVLRYALIFL